jgi:subtilisin family serine protease
MINLSLAGKGSIYSFYLQVKDAVESGVSVFAAAGNENEDVGGSITTVPCAVPNIVCIGAADANYKKAKFSNYGLEVKYIAPGKDILSLGISYDKAVVMDSGTSMACPHAVGAGAIFTSVSLIWA